MNKAIFLDRDGVLNNSVIKNGKPYPPDSLKELTIPTDVPIGLKLLKEAGYYLIVCTNQPDVGRGQTKQEIVDEIHEHLMRVLPLDHIYVCFDPKDGGPRRKPNPGMLLEGRDKFGIDMTTSYMIGDRWRDVEAGRLAGCSSIFIDLGYTEDWPVQKPEHTVKSFGEAVDLILRTSS